MTECCMAGVISHIINIHIINKASLSFGDRLCLHIALRVGDLILFEALTGGAFDRLNWQNSGNLTKTFQKSQMHRGLPWVEMGGFGIDRYINTVRRVRPCRPPMCRPLTYVFLQMFALGRSRFVKSSSRPELNPISMCLVISLS